MSEHIFEGKKGKRIVFAHPMEYFMGSWIDYCDGSCYLKLRKISYETN